MIIGYDAKRAYLNGRGLGNYSRNLISLMADTYSAVDFYLFTSKDSDSFVKSSHNIHKVLPSPVNSMFPSLWRTRLMVSDIKRNGVELYHGLSNEIPYGIEKTSIKTVVTIHDVMFLQFPHLYKYVDRKIYAAKYLHSCNIADKIVAVSEQTKKDLIKYSPENESKIEVITQACNPIYEQKYTDNERERIKKKYNLPSQYLLTVSAVEERKNQLQILRSLVAGNIDIPYVIVGRKSEYAEKIMQYAYKNKIENNIIFLTGVPDYDLPAIYQSSSAFVFPSVYEGFGIPLVEAMTSGIPIVCSKGDCFRETLGNSAIFCGNNPEEWADAIISVLENKEKKDNLVNGALEFTKRYSTLAIAEKTMKLYKSIL